jgi:hypothetical protein
MKRKRQNQRFLFLVFDSYIALLSMYEWLTSSVLRENQDVRVASDKQPDEVSRQQQHTSSNFAASTTQTHFKSSVVELNPGVVNQVDTMKSAGGSLGSSVPRTTKEPALLDERSLLACIVRAVPAGTDGGIRISTTVSYFSSSLSC